APKAPAFQVAERQTRTVSDDIGRLVPADAAVFAHVSSLEGVEAKVKDLVKSFQPGMENMVDLTPLYGMVGLRARDLDASKPAGLALKLSEMGPPQRVLILPAKSAKDVADIAEAPIVVSGDYVGVGMGGEASLADTASPLGRELPAGDVAVRVKLDEVLAPFRPQIEMYLNPEMLAQMNPAAQQDPASKAGLEFATTWIKRLLDHAKTLEASMSLNEGKLDLGFVFKVAQGSAMDAGPAATDRNLPYLAGSLPLPDASIVYLLSANPASFYDAFAPMYDAMAADMPAEQAAQFKTFLKQSQEMYKHVGDNTVMAMDFTPNGLQGVGLMEAKDPVKFQADWDSFMANYMTTVNTGALGVKGVRLAALEPVEVSGVSFKVFTFTMDFAAMMEAQGTPLGPDESEQLSEIMETVLGKGGMKLGMGVEGSNIVFIMGDIQDLGTKTIAALRTGKRHKLAMIEATTGRLHANPGFLFAVDVRRFTRSIMAALPPEWAEKAPAVPDGAAIPVWIACAAAGPVYELQASVDLRGIAGMVQAMSK
ncbi:MAG: hypothetical protein ACYST0_08170, partial [Planctomycetota bacterium]